MDILEKTSFPKDPFFEIFRSRNFMHHYLQLVGDMPLTPPVMLPCSSSVASAGAVCSQLLAVVLGCGLLLRILKVGFWTHFFWLFIFLS